METLKVKHTYDIKLAGQPSKDVVDSPAPSKVAVLPASIPLIKPKLLVKEGAKVKVGTPLFFDKQDDRLIFLSPGAGTVSSIVYGERRAIEQVVITLDKKEAAEELPSFDAKSLASADRDSVVDALLKAGLWSYLKAFPFRSIPSPDDTPPAIYVSIDFDEAFTPDSSVFLNGKLDEFKFGLEVLKKISGGDVYVACAEKNQAIFSQFSSVISHRLSGAYPANDTGVFLYYHKTSSEQNNSWGVSGYDVLRIAETLLSGSFQTEQVIVKAGPRVSSPSHVKVRAGAPMETILNDVDATNTRVIAGGVLTGRKSGFDSFLGYADVAVNVIDENEDPELFSFFRLGFNKPTFSKAYLSSLLGKAKYSMSANLHGGDRSCISCGACPQVCPVGIYPQLLMKSLYDNDVESAIDLGLLDCTECGLCTYVCPSKINLDDIIGSKRSSLAKAMRK